MKTNKIKYEKCYLLASDLDFDISGDKQEIMTILSAVVSALKSKGALSEADIRMAIDMGLYPEKTLLKALKEMAKELFKEEDEEDETKR